MKKLLLLACLTLLTSFPALAKTLPDAAKTEINQLLNRLEQSNCQFNRNGNWYLASEAKTHLNKKLDYLASHGEVGTTEEFIQLAASKSSMSGKPYYVQCPGTAQTESSLWLGTQLKQLRGQK